MKKYYISVLTFLITLLSSISALADTGMWT